MNLFWQMLPFEMIKSKILLVLATLVAVSCTKESSINKFSDDVLVKIADYQDKRQSDSLYQYLSHENAVYRRDAALAFASIQDTSSIDVVAKLLTDASNEVRNAAAFALGQIGGEKAFQYLVNTQQDSLVSQEILEAIGKSIQDISQLPDNISSWGLYRIGLRGLADSTLVKKAIGFLKSDSEYVRLGAAHFYTRGPADISFAESALIKSAQEDPSVYVRMVSASALRKIKTQASLEAIAKILKTDTDYRVRVNAVRLLQVLPIAQSKSYLFAALNDSSTSVTVAASEGIRSTITKAELSELVSMARAAKHWRVKANLYEAALSVSNSKEISEEVFKEYELQQNPYAKAALLNALGQSTIAVGFILDKLSTEQELVLKSTAATALVAINRHKEFYSDLSEILLEGYKKGMATGDPAVIGIFAAALGDSTLGYKKMVTDYAFLYEAKSKLSLPRDNEALQPLESTIAYFEGKKNTVEVKNEFNNPIDWALVKTIPADQKVLIKTDKGDIILRLLVEEAPGSVANFVKLVNTNYFDAKNFHRVVPNFVIQGGCNRGDGWGSEDYSIRSEFSRRRYVEGSVGMASAGKDTEGTQWFITHSPTPHLDGRYSIFAFVEKGMDVVHKIEVGDRIIKAELIK
jgi:cyclophilin family peptidyl-prolyl cis-trans isomerase/HEAT repeat protein